MFDEVSVIDQEYHLWWHPRFDVQQRKQSPALITDSATANETRRQVKGRGLDIEESPGC